ncbi:uncharacterized protein Triagg1_8310 [Trichoderma aggressivum f. europaeum]|uniref:Thymocyte nuclear protein 1 n=1 Tax=Trichoderma aggressivum f. europaeum TaxID=173218 RepID=A0AAE1LXZ0_9HYPO|nr:hypothetical protein Triagg1_8310 [Trichoderma aggressivum f. europaeum]
MPPRKRIREGGEAAEPVAKRRSSRQAAASIKKADEEEQAATEVNKAARPKVAERETKSKNESVGKPAATTTDDKKKAAKKANKTGAKKKDDQTASSAGDKAKAERAASQDPDIDAIPATNPDAPRHDGEWYWLMKAEPETRLENGIDVRFSIDDLRAKEKPEGWDGIRAYAARNHMRNMNQGDKAFFYHSNCKEPGIAGIMEIVKEFSEDSKFTLSQSARRPGTPYYDPQSSKDNVRWSLVHVEFRKKFAVPISLKELRELGKPGGPLENMQMLKQGRLSVSRVSAEEWKALCEIADKKAEEAGLKHETTKLTK